MNQTLVKSIQKELLKQIRKPVMAVVSRSTPDDLTILQVEMNLQTAIDFFNGYLIGIEAIDSICINGGVDSLFTLRVKTGQLSYWLSINETL